MQNDTAMREKQLNIRLNEEESARLERVAAHYGLNAAGLFRMLVKREDDALSPVPAGAGSTKARTLRRVIMLATGRPHYTTGNVAELTGLPLKKVLAELHQLQKKRVLLFVDGSGAEMTYAAYGSVEQALDLAERAGFDLDKPL